MRRSLIAIAAGLAAASAHPAFAAAQVMASEYGTVSQRVDGTTITIDYFRPERRDRTNLIGGVVPFGSTWTPGANWATTIEVDHDVRIEGHDVAKGRYSVWMIPEPDPQPWTVILSTTWKRFHVQGPDPSASDVRFMVKPDQAPMVDVLTFTFPVVDRDAATLLLQWGTTAVSLHITVTPSNSVSPTG